MESAANALYSWKNIKPRFFVVLHGFVVVERESPRGKDGSHDPQLLFAMGVAKPRRGFGTVSSFHVEPTRNLRMGALCHLVLLQRALSATFKKAVQ